MGLRVIEERDLLLERLVLRSKLKESRSGLGTEVLPQHKDAKLVWGETGSILFTGAERLVDAAYAQTWVV